MALAAVPQLQGVFNFRPVSPSLPGLYRSANLDQATAADAAYILDGAKVRTIIDLRNQDEIERAATEATEFGQKLLRAFDEGASVGTSQVASEGHGRLSRHHVPLMEDVDGFLDAIASRLPAAKKAQAAVLRSFDMRKHDQLVYDALAKGKQQLMYTAMLQSTSPRSWRRALHLAADRRQGGVLIHCAQGKDRTGVLSALLQHAAGDAEEDIISAYSMSEVLLEGSYRVSDYGDRVASSPSLRVMQTILC